jgi:hypothetical protein
MNRAVMVCRYHHPWSSSPISFILFSAMDDQRVHMIELCADASIQSPARISGLWFMEHGCFTPLYPKNGRNPYFRMRNESGDSANRPLCSKSGYFLHSHGECARSTRDVYSSHVPYLTLSLSMGMCLSYSSFLCFET